jgi:hypothetical protein
MVRAAASGTSVTLVGVLGTYLAHERRSLALARAELLAVSLGEAFAPPVPPVVQTGLTPVLLVPALAETIWLVFAARQGDGQ